MRATPDFAKQSCQILALDVVLVLIAWIAAACLCFLCLTGFAYGIPVADVSAQGAKLVVTTSLAHFLLTWARPEVTFSGTGVPDLDSKRFSVKPLSSFQLTLSASESSLDTSMGHLHVKSLRGFLVMGFWRCPLIGWCILFLGVFSASISQISWSLTLVVSSLGMCTGALAFALRRRQGRTPLVKRYRQFFKEWPLALECSNRGPERSMAAGQLQDFIQFFETFIKDRSMYYACSNIIKPLTEPYQLSFVEVVGSTKMEWFVSHYWGMSVRHFGDAIRKHALSYREAWRDSGYWICTFSNNQWRVEEELGQGNWQQSSFYLALQSPDCQGTTMIIDELVLPLQRIWCLFEVYHTIRLAKSGRFQGLLLCTSTGVLQEGKAGTDVAVAVAKTAKELDTQAAQATAEEDRLMIHGLIEQMPGGFETMNAYVRETICHALEASHQHFERTFSGLVCDLTSHPLNPLPSPSLPTLLTSAPQCSDPGKSM